MRRRTSKRYFTLTFVTFCLLLQQSTAFARGDVRAESRESGSENAIETLVQRRAKNLGTGMNLTFLDHHWKGAKENGFSDFLDSIDVQKRKDMLREIARAGYETVRIPVCFSAWVNNKAPYSWRSKAGLEALDKTVKWAREKDLNVIIDQHHPELDGSIESLTDIERIEWIWKQVAERYKDTDPDRVYFELWNEPHDIEAKAWRKKAARLITKVRSIVPSHSLIVGFHDWNGRQAMIDSKPFSDKNLIYTFHFYDPFVFTHQGASWSAEGLPDISGVPFPYDKAKKINIPDSAKGKWAGGLIQNYERDSSSKKIYADLRAAKEWSVTNGVPIYVGEFGSYTKYADQESRCRHFTVLYKAFRKLGLPNAAWEWDGGFNMFKNGSGEILPCVKSAAGLKGNSKWSLTWSDEFQGPAGSGIDKTKWSHRIGGGGWGNKEFQYYTDTTKNSFHDGQGNLVIKAIEEGSPEGTKCWYGECRYTSARLVTEGKFAPKYGKIEARIKVPYGQGIWPAFWMLGDDFKTKGWPDSGEIDILENIGREPGKVYGTIHGPGYAGAKGIGKSFKLESGKKFTDNFHVFAIEWEPNEIRWYVDGKHFHTVRPKDLPKGAKWVYDHPHFMLLNLAVGGNWPGSPDNTTVFPQQMKIDYVRVYEKS